MSKTVLITGCSSGMGREAVKLFQKNGWNVVATMRRPEEETELNQLENVVCLKLDVLDVKTIRSAVSKAQKQFGGIDVLINNAGYGLVGAFESFSDEQIRRQFDTNVFGLMNVTREVLPMMRSRQHGVIVNVASMAGRIPMPFHSVYNSSKWAVEGYSECLQYELQPFNIRVKVVEPGACKTEFFGRSSDRANQRGETAYQAAQDAFLGVMDTAGTGGAEAWEAAAVIYQAATDESSRMRFSVGRDAKGLLTARRLLPDVVYHPMVKMALNPTVFRYFGGIFYRLPKETA